MDEFISEDDLLTFEGFLKYQAIPPTSTPEELKPWRDCFDENVRRRESSPKVGLMKLQPKCGEQKYAVAIKHGAELWLTMWVRCSGKGEVFIMYPRGDRDMNPHASYHLDGTLHQKTYGLVGLSQKRQPLTEAFKGSEHLGFYSGHGRSSGAVCKPTAFDGVVIVEPNILGPKHGSIGIELVKPGYEPAWDGDSVQHFNLNAVHQKQTFPRHGRPSVVITIQR